MAKKRGENRAKNGRFLPRFFGPSTDGKGNSQMERENSEDRQHKKRLSFLYIDRFVTKQIERLLRSLAMG